MAKEDPVQATLSSFFVWLPLLVGAIAILIVGWIVARIVSAGIKALLRRTGLADRLAGMLGRQGDPTAAKIPGWLASIVFWVIILFVLIAFFQVLGLTFITQPLNNFLVIIFGYVPKLLAAAGLALVAWVVAVIVRALVVRLLTAARVDERLNHEAGAEPGAVSLSKTLGELVFWLILLLFLPAIVGTLGLVGLLLPVQDMVDKLLAFLPNLFAAAIIFLVGWFVARIVRRIVTGLLVAAGADRLGARLGLGRSAGTQTLSSLVGLIVYILILMPVITATLNALQLPSITTPISNMLNQLLSALPNIFAAALVLIIAYVVGRLVAGLVSNLLAGFGFDNLPTRLGLRASAPGATTWSQIAGTIVLAVIMLGAALEAAQLLNFAALTALLADFITFASHILLGLVILALGLWLANLAARAIQSSSITNAGLLSMVARAAILVLAAAMALRAMGLANDIINLAFGLLLGAIAVAAALAFGLGGRETAGREIQRWVDNLRGPKI
jgi:hypothetical protein